MKQHDVAAIFKEIADLLELKGDNPFRVRAYQRAAQNLESFTGDLDRLATEERLRELPGIGADLAAKIREYLRTGRVAVHEELRASVAPGVLELLHVPGLGPKTAKLLSERLKIASIEALEVAARAHRLQDLPGMGPTKEQNILKGIAIVKKGQERMDLGLARSLAEEFLKQLKSIPGVSRLSVAGSLRRMKETIGDLDLLVSSSSAAKVMETFVHLPQCARVLAAGHTKSSILTTNGVQVDLRVVAPNSFGAALQYFTGSKEHNVKLRELAVRQGRKVNEYGVFRASTNRRLAGREEEDVYRALGLLWIPPELREDTGEIESAQACRLPTLANMEDVQGDFHVHTTWSDGSDTLEEMVAAAKIRGYAYLAICDHSQSLKVAHGMSIARLTEQLAKIRALNAHLKGFRILTGAEVDILGDGRMDYPNEVLARLDFVVGSIHSGFTQSEATLTKRMVAAMENPYVTLIGHPTGRLMGQREPYPLNFETVCAAAKATGTALEINAYPKRLDLTDLAARKAKDAGVMLAVSTDTHSRDQFDHMPIGLSVARRAWCEPQHLLNCFNLEQLLTWINRKRSKATRR